MPPLIDAFNKSDCLHTSLLTNNHATPGSLIILVYFRVQNLRKIFLKTYFLCPAFSLLPPMPESNLKWFTTGAGGDCQVSLRLKLDSSTSLRAVANFCRHRHFLPAMLSPPPSPGPSPGGTLELDESSLGKT